MYMWKKTSEVDHLNTRTVLIQTNTQINKINTRSLCKLQYYYTLEVNE